MFLQNNNKITQTPDWIIIILYLLLVTIGWFSIFASAYSSDFTSIFNFSMVYGKQLIWIGSSLILIVFIMVLDVKVYTQLTYWIYGFTVFMLLAVLAIGSTHSGAKSWFGIGNLGVQPSEFAKIGTALLLASFISDKQKKRSLTNKEWLQAILIILIPIILIILQKDTGSALVFFFFTIMFYREGLTGKIMLAGITAIILFVLTLIFNELYIIALITIITLFLWLYFKKSKKYLFKLLLIYISTIGFIFLVNTIYISVLQQHQKKRIDSIIGKSSDPKGADYNLNQSKIAIGSGGFAGKGFLNGTQTKLDFVPEQSTDFIFCTIGEERGFIGSFTVFVLYAALILRILYKSEKQRSAFTRIYGYGVVCILFAHFMINIGMTIGLIPVIGIPLPFLSYGGSSLWAFTILLFIFVKLDTLRNSYV